MFSLNVDYVRTKTNFKVLFLDSEIGKAIFEILAKYCYSDIA